MALKLGSEFFEVCDNTEFHLNLRTLMGLSLGIFLSQFLIKSHLRDMYEFRITFHLGFLQLIISCRTYGIIKELDK